MRGIHAPFKPPRLLSGSSNQSVGKPLSVTSQSPEPNVAGIKKLKPNPDLPTPAERDPKLDKRYYTVQWRRYTNKKNKSWDGDGFIVVTSQGITLKSNVKVKNVYKVLARTKKIDVKGVIFFGQYEAEVDYEITSRLELQQFLGEAESEEVSQPPISQPVLKPFIKVSAHTASKGPLHPIEDSSIVLPPPPNTTEYIDVVIDPQVARHLRPHQVEGVIFLYECLMGFRSPQCHGRGALLADEMGLGKTLMTITTIWTLLKQSPFKAPEVKKVLIACPVTLIDNWRKEFKKWLDMNRIGCLAMNSKTGSSTVKDKQDIINFGKTNVYQVLIMGYEKILSCQNELKTVKFDLLVCDEGHRLKNKANKALKVFQELNIDKKIVLTGTPIQNDLQEFYNIIDFVNHGSLGSFASFQKTYLTPILRSRDVNCKNKDVIKRGEDASNELIQLTSKFILRRTSDYTSDYLPSKTDIILFCPPTKLQIKLFHSIMQTKRFDSLMVDSNVNNALPLITLFKKLCNSPALLKNDKFFNSIAPESVDVSKLTTFASSKINILIPLLLEFRKINAKTVLISNYTQTLDMLQQIVQKLNIPFTRLDGSTSNKLRDSIVTSFNKSPEISVFLLSSKSGGVGLNLVGASRLILFDNDWNPSVDLQAMARIHRDGQKKPVFIYRIMTTGCIDEKIFQRQIMKSNLSDKFLDGMPDSKLDTFDITDLKDLFTINEETNCNTHELLRCTCSGNGDKLEYDLEPESDQETENDWISALDFKQADEKPKRTKISIRNALAGYKHFDPANAENEIKTGDPIIDEIIQKSKNNDDPPISFVLTKLNPSKMKLGDE